MKEKTTKKAKLKPTPRLKIEINQGHYFELLDRTHVACCMIDTHLLSHPLATVDEDIKFKLEQALGILYETYQLIGSKRS
jgi:hypothetical protein